MKNIKHLFSGLFWKISLIFLLLLISLAALYIYITATSADTYYQEANQKLNRDIAAHIAGDVQPFVDGEINQPALEELFHNVMVLNPSIEIYLLDKSGKILSYFAPYSVVVLDTVPLQPIHNFIADTSGAFITGKDPRHPDQQKVFSAAAVTEDNDLFGYIYVVLAGEEYASVTQLLLGSYRLRVAVTTIIISFLAALLIGLFAIWYITRHFNKIRKTVTRFQQGDYTARIDLNGDGEFKELAASFNEMADKIVKNIEELKSVERLRKELIANVSHDLRTPLATIHGYTETLLLKDTQLPEAERQKYSQIILKGTERIKRMVDELFELSKLESDQVQMHYEHFSLQELVQDIVQKYQIMADKRNVKIETTLPQDLPLIYADIALIDRALQNLIENAIKYTSSGGKVIVELNKTTDGLEVIVSDTGLGIPKDELPFIFDRYRRATNIENGTGLGLTIVKKILELHKTSINVVSEPDKGTTFSFFLKA